MNISFDLNTDKGDHLRVALSVFAKNILPDSVIEHINQINIYDVVLERISGINPISISSLTKIANFLFNFLSENPNAILYFFCDDKNNIEFNKNNKPHLLPQEYRSKIFSILFERICKKECISNFTNMPIHIETPETTFIIHLIYPDSHEEIASVLINELKSLAEK